MPAHRPNRIPSYRLHKPSGRAVVTLNGRDIYLGRHDTPESRQEYDRLIAEWIAGGRQPAVAARSCPTIVEIIAAYWPHVQRYYRKAGRPTSEIGTIRSALRPLKRLYGHTLAIDFGPLALKALREAMIEKGWCRRHVNGQISRVKAMFRWAVENELVPPSVYHGLRAVCGLRKGRSDVRESDPVRPVADTLVDAVRPHVSRQIWAMIELQRLTGMRSGEVTDLKLCNELSLEMG